MKGDFTRNTFDPSKGYTKVGFQEGRVILDADLNEAQDIALHELRADMAAYVGSGVAAPSTAFSLKAVAPGLEIQPGTMFVEGMQVENPQAIQFAGQPYPPSAALPTNAPSPTDYLAFVRAWDVHRTGIEDPTLRDPVLAGADAATRTKAVWQVDVVKVSGPTHPEYLTAIARSSGTLTARATPVTATEADPCLSEPGEASHDLENQLYRVEVHQRRYPLKRRSVL